MTDKLKNEFLKHNITQNTMGFNVKDKVCIVTGSAQGIGEEIARRLLNHGAKVCISDINEARCGETALKFQEHYGKDHVTFSRLVIKRKFIKKYNVIQKK